MRRLCFLLCALSCVMGLILWKQEKSAPEVSASPVPQITPVVRTVQPDRIVVEVIGEISAADKLAQAAPASMSIQVYDEGQVKKTDLEEYLIHVVAGEMPASYEEEALKAQAVAARSYISWKMPAYGGSGCSRGVNADVCTDSTHCMAYKSKEDMHRDWGENYDAYYDKIARAVYDTAGQVMLYNGVPIQALFHSSSGGRTEDAQAVWGTAFPYLQSVDSAGETNTNNVTRMKISEMVEKLNAAFDGAGLTESNVRTQFVVRSVTSSGRADVVKVGRVTATGRAVRSALELNSTDFTVSYDGKDVVIETIGYGHGVGMSQVGANVMAQNGSGYAEILKHYYTGVSLEELSAVGA